MKRAKKLGLLSLLAALCAFAVALTQVSAQQEAPAPGRGQSVADTLESIQKARVVTRVLFTVAHPDDEASTLLTYLPHALGTDTTLLTLNRGEGGQNAIGPEQGAQLGILRSSELSAAMNVEGPHLLFHARRRFRIFKDARRNARKMAGPGTGRHGARHPHAAPANRNQRLGRPENRPRQSSGFRLSNAESRRSRGRSHQVSRPNCRRTETVARRDDSQSGARDRAGRESGLHRLLGGARRRHFSDLGPQLPRHFARRLLASPLAGRDAVPECPVRSAPVWLEARDGRAGFAVRFCAAAHVACTRDSSAGRGFARGCRPRARSSSHGGGKTRLARRGALHRGSGQTDCFPRRPGEALAGFLGRGRIVGTGAGARANQSRALPTPRRSKSFPTPTAASLSPAKVSACAPK